MRYAIIRFLAWLWKVIWWFLSVVVVGVVIGVITAAITTSLSGASALLSWPVGGALVLAALLTLCAWLAHRYQQPASPYVLKQVEHLDPNTTDFYVPRYVASVYLPRPADDAARQALRRAAQRSERSPASEPLGICIVGKPTMGKTRLAWEAMRAELPGWTLVKWSHNPPSFDYPAQRGRRVVLAIDDAQEYANANEATTLNSLPEAFRAVDARLVIVVTCRDGNDWENACKTLGKLLERLTPVSLTEITDAQADQLAALLKDAGEETQREQFDNTPGSLLLGVARMRDERYPKLLEPAKKLLRTLKLLRSARIYDYPAPRVRAAAADLFQLADLDWTSARDAALRAGFLRLGELDESGERALAPVADVYLERAVLDYPVPGAQMADDWPALKQSLTRRRDAAALNSLGNAFSEYPLGNLRANRQHAETCYRAALEVYTRREAPADWAQTQSNLAVALSDQAELAEGAERTRLLGGGGREVSGGIGGTYPTRLAYRLGTNTEQPGYCARRSGGAGGGSGAGAAAGGGGGGVSGGAGSLHAPGRASRLGDAPEQPGYCAQRSGRVGGGSRAEEAAGGGGGGVSGSAGGAHAAGSASRLGEDAV